MVMKNVVCTHHIIPFVLHPFIHLHYHMYTYVFPVYMYIYHINTIYRPNTPLNTLYTPYIHHYMVGTLTASSLRMWACSRATRRRGFIQSTWETYSNIRKIFKCANMKICKCANIQCNIQCSDFTFTLINEMLHRVYRWNLRRPDTWHRTMVPCSYTELTLFKPFI